MNRFSAQAQTQSEVMTQHNVLVSQLNKWSNSATLPSLSVGNSSDYTEIESDGTIHFHGNATVFEDDYNTLSGQRLTVPGSR